MSVYYIITMKTVKSTGKVNKSTFFDRIRIHEQPISSKQNIDINHIRQSSYKLQRTKSHKTEHSLERKAPILTPYPESLSKHKYTQTTHTDNTITRPHYKIRIDDCLKKENATQEGASHSNDRNFGLSSNFNELINLLQMNRDYHQEVPQKHTMSLQQQEECINLIKIIWEAISRIKQHSFLRRESINIQTLLKNMVLRLARPKLQGLQQRSAASLKVPAFRQTPPDNNCSSHKQINHNNIYNFISSTLQNKYDYDLKGISFNKATQQLPEEDLEFRKIMYILQQSKKHGMHSVNQQSNDKSKNCYQHLSSQNDIEKEQSIHEQSYLDNPATKPFKEHKMHLSSFNSNATSSNRTVVYQQEKLNNSASNDRLFLKNIVKKAKNTISKDKQPSVISNQPYNQSAASSSNNSDITIFKNISSINSEPQQQITEQQQYSLTVSDGSQARSFADGKEGPSKLMSQLSQNCTSESESKRATLNNIINMLNHRYNKNIKLQPRKT